MADSVYGYCPFCGRPGRSRESRPDGFDTCDAGHKYKSKDAKKEPKAETTVFEPPKVKHRYTYESMWRGCTRLFNIRVWKAQADLQNLKPDNFDKVVRDLDVRWASIHEIAETLAAMEDVNAVEVLDRHGNGVVVYKDWP